MASHALPSKAEARATGRREKTSPSSKILTNPKNRTHPGLISRASQDHNSKTGQHLALMENRRHGKEIRNQGKARNPGKTRSHGKTGATGPTGHALKVSLVTDSLVKVNGRRRRTMKVPLS